jgi:hypothetical protein
MLLYRVAPYLATITDSAVPGHPEYLHRPQGNGRVDNPSLYDVWYLSLTEAGAVGEVFASHPKWNDSIFKFRKLRGARYSLHTFSVPDNCPIIDLDDAQSLLDRGLRPTQIVSLNRTVTQAWAKRLFHEPGATGPAWHGARWWSRLYPDWPVIGLWRTKPSYVRNLTSGRNSPGGGRCSADVEPLD